MSLTCVNVGSGHSHLIRNAPEVSGLPLSETPFYLGISFPPHPYPSLYVPRKNATEVPGAGTQAGRRPMPGATAQTPTEAPDWRPSEKATVPRTEARH